MKTLFGMVSDAIPIKGYHKRFYIIGAAVLCATAIAIIAVRNATVRVTIVYTMCVESVFVCVNV